MQLLVNSRLVRLTAVLAVAWLLGGTSRVHAVLLVYEGFDYAPGLLIDGGVGRDGGTGFAGPWDQVQGENFSTQVVSGSLGYTDSLGNVLQTSGGRLFNTGETGTSQPGRQLAARRDGSAATEATPTSTWLSFLATRQGQLNDFVEGNLESGTFGRGANLTLFDSTLGNEEKLNFGENTAFQFPVVDGAAFLRIQREDPTQIPLLRQTFGKSGTLAVTAVDYWQFNAPRVNGNIRVDRLPEYEDPDDGPIANLRDWQKNPVDGRFRAQFSQTPFADEVSLMVARIDHYGGATPLDKVHIWMNPDLNATPADDEADAHFDLAAIQERAQAQLNEGQVDVEPFFSGTAGNQFSFDRLRFFAGNDALPRHFAEFVADEIRIGETFADVTPHTAAAPSAAVPEPGSLVLFVMGATLASSMKRRRG